MPALALQLEQLENAQLVRRTPDEDLSYLFKHALTQESAYGSLLVKKRREIHRLVAQAYEELYPERLDEFAAWLAAHYAEAGDDARVLNYARRAGDVAARIYANTEAAAQYSLALDAAARTAAPSTVLEELYLKRGRAYELLSEFDQAARNYDEMQSAAQQRGDRAFELSALIARALIRAIPGSARDPEGARVLAKQALTLAQKLSDRKAEAKIYWIILLANIYFSGNNQEAIENGERSLAIARELNLREQMAYSLHDLFVAYSYQGDLDKARAVRLEAAEIWRELDNKPMLAENITGIGVFYYLLGDYTQAQAVAREGYRISDEIANLGGQGFSSVTCALAQIQLGEFDLALRSLDAAVPIADLGGLEGSGISVLGLRAWVCACCGEVARARELIHEALRRASADFTYQQLYLNAVWMRVELLAGNTTEAARIKGEGKVELNPDQFERMFPPSADIAYLAAGELALAQGEWERALAVFDGLLARLDKQGTRADRALALWHKGQALDGLKRPAQAREVWAEARAGAETARERPVLWQILLALTDFERARGNADEARVLYAQARQALQFVEDHIPQQYRESFQKLPRVSDALNRSG